MKLMDNIVLPEATRALDCLKEKKMIQILVTDDMLNPGVAPVKEV